MIKKTLLVVLLVLLSCKNEDTTVEQSSQFTKNQKQIISWFNLALAQRNINHFLIEKYADSITKQVANESPNFKALGLLCYGNYYNSINNDSLSFKNYNEALNIVRQTKNDSLLTSAYYGIGNYYKHTGDYPKSMEHFLTALKSIICLIYAQRLLLLNQ